MSKPTIQKLIQQDVKDIKDQSIQTGLMVQKIRTDLDYHIKRTDLLEAEFKPVKLHVAIVGAVGKIIIALFSIGAAGAAIWRVFIG